MRIHENRWTVDVFIDEYDGFTRARATLDTASGAERLTGVGLSRCNPTDRDIPEIGDELACARALSDLAHRLLETAAADIAAVAPNRSVTSP